MPLFVFAGIAPDDYLAEWQRHAWEYGIGLVVLGLMVAGFWLRQRRADEALLKSEENLRKSLSLLQATLESTADAILVVDLNNTWRLHNKQFVELWNIPDEILSAKNDNAALSYVINWKMRMAL